MKRVLFSLVFAGLMACHAAKKDSQMHEEQTHEPGQEKEELPFPLSDLNQEELNTVAARIGYTSGSGHPDDGKCIGCHQNFHNIDELDRLYYATSNAFSCFQGGVKTQEQAQEVLSCLARLVDDDGDVKSMSPSALGFMAAGVEHKAFRELFIKAGREADYEDFKQSAGMPLGGTAFRDEDFQKLLSWVLNYYPGLAGFLTHDGPDVCRSPRDTRIGKRFHEHVKHMSEDGQSWEHVNIARGLPMFACVDGDKHKCFTQKSRGQDVFPLADAWKAPGREGHIRVLFQYDESTNYWIRSSADGRFVANGGTPSAVIDLQDILNGRSARKVAVEALYDPVFLPDNSGFMFQGDAHGSRLCEQSILEQGDLITIDFLQLGCSTQDLQVGLYQAIGSNLDNGDIRTLSGYYSSDDGYTLVRDQAPLFGKAAALNVETIRRVNDRDFEKVSSQKLLTPYHGNWMLAPSNQAAVAIVSASTDGKARHGGYRLFLMDEAFGQEGQWTNWDDDTSALICTGGGEKPNISFDERMLAYYRYAEHPQAVDALNSSSDIYVYDLLRGQGPVALTQMPQGYYAQFPHFRSDGWLYFSVYKAETEERFIVATDMSLHIF